MNKICIVFMLILLMIPSAFVCAEETAVLPVFDVTLNGQKVESEFRQFPLFVYKDITYVPMTYFDCRYLGLCTEWDGEKKTLSIEKRMTTCAYRDYNGETENEREHAVSVCDFSVTVNGEPIDNRKEAYPLLMYRDVTYFPLTWRFAVEAFGWEYHFDSETGLRITSENPHVETVSLPGITGGVATDGEYYYYNGNKDGKTVVYRAYVSAPDTPEVIHEVPEGILGSGVSFVNSNGEIYIRYFVGSGAVMSTEYHYKIEKDGTVTRQRPRNYSGGKHGYSEFTKESDGIFVKGVTEYPDSATKLTYTADGAEKEAEPLPGRVQIGLKRNGIKDDNADRKHENVRIFEGKVYYTAMDLDAGTDSALYCLDTRTGKQEKLLNGVLGFHVYNGWLQEENAESIMILFDQNGQLMRYSGLNGDIRAIENDFQEPGMVLDTAVGTYDIYAVLKTVSGDRTVVKAFSDYASGDGSFREVTVLDTKARTAVSCDGETLCLSVAEESPEDEIRLMAVGNNISPFYASDAAGGFIYENILLYRIGDAVARVELSKN